MAKLIKDNQDGMFNKNYYDFCYIKRLSCPQDGVPKLPKFTYWYMYLHVNTITGEGIMFLGTSMPNVKYTCTFF